MDPVSKEIDRFRESFRDFRENLDARILHVITQPEQAGNIIKALRIEEWQPDNRCPFLIFNTAYTDKEPPFEEMCTVLQEHHRLLKKGMSDQNIDIPDLNVALSGKEDPDFAFALYIQDFHNSIRGHFDGLLVCWLPTDIVDKRGWQKSVIKLLSLPFDPAIRFVIADEDRKALEKEFRKSPEILVTTDFHVDDRETLDYFKKLMGTDGSSANAVPPSVPGAPLGAARPDVPPPPRKVGVRQPTEDEIKTAIEASGSEPALTPRESDRLRRLVFDAAVASGENRPEDAIRLQQMACDICHEAGVKLEEVLMIMVLATYYQQSNQRIRAVEEYRRSESLALDMEAYAQVTQIRMSLAYLYLMHKVYDLAAVEYEKAAESAQKIADPIMRIEALRMAGTCYLQIKDRDRAERCWRKAVESGQMAEPDQIKLSTFMDVASSLIELLRKMRMKEQARSVELMVMQIGEKTRKEKEVEE